MDSVRVPTKIDLTPRRHHGYAFFLFILGCLFPPLAVAARFGIGKDFWLNLLLTICGYIPGHGHNFYIQNIRNNKNHRRTPKWAQRYGLVDTSDIQRKAKKSQWAGRYNDRLPNSTLDNQPYEEGQEQSSVDTSSESGHRARGLWRPEDEAYYGERAQDSSSTDAQTSGSSGRWRYPANFEDTVPVGAMTGSKKSRKKKEKKDRWERTEDAYSLSEERATRKKSKKKKSKSSVAPSIASRDSTTDFPEDPEGGLYGDRKRGQSEEMQGSEVATKVDDVFSHQF